MLRSHRITSDKAFREAYSGALERAGLGWLSGCLVTLLVSSVLAGSFVYLFLGWTDGLVAFRNLMMSLSTFIGFFVVPVSVIMGLAYGRSVWLPG